MTAARLGSFLVCAGVVLIGSILATAQGPIVWFDSGPGLAQGPVALIGSPLAPAHGPIVKDRPWFFRTPLNRR